MLGTGSRAVLSESIQLLVNDLLFYKLFRYDKEQKKQSFEKIIAHSHGETSMLIITLSTE